MAKRLSTLRGQFAARTDDWQNAMTGFGVSGVDKRLGGQAGYTILDQLQAEAIWRGDDLANRVITTIPHEILREGWECLVQDEKQMGEDMDAAFEEMGLTHHLLTALEWERAYGGSALLLGADDGAPMDKLYRPLNEDKIRSFDWVNHYSPRELVPVDYYSRMLDRDYGRVATYRLTPLDHPPGNDEALNELPVIHESRIVRWEGVRVSRQQILRNVQPGWGDSVLVRLLQVIQDFQASWAGAIILLQDFAPAVLKLKNLARVIAGQAAGAGTSLQARARGLELARSIANTTIIDAEEEYERKGTPVSGYADIMAAFWERVASAVDMPVGMLKGQSPSGLNSSDEGEIEWWYNQVRAKQARKLQQQLRRMYKLLFLCKTGPTKGKVPDNWCIQFNPLQQMTDQERAMAHYQQAQADVAYVTAQILTPEEVAISRFGGDKYTMETQIDTEKREELADDEDIVEMRLGAQEDDVFPPPPEPPVIAPGGKTGPATKQKGPSKSKPAPGARNPTQGQTRPVNPRTRGK